MDRCSCDEWRLAGMKHSQFEDLNNFEFLLVDLFSSRLKIDWKMIIQLLDLFRIIEWSLASLV